MAFGGVLGSIVRYFIARDSRVTWSPDKVAGPVQVSERSTDRKSVRADSGDGLQ